MCMNPVVIIKDNNGQWHYMNRREFLEKGRGCNGEVAFVPCGRCPACAKAWRDQLSQRATAEFNKYGYNRTFMLNLTVNDECIDKVFPNGSLDHKEFQKFMKRLRINLERKKGFTGKIKYLLGAEYGENNNRPHFHLIVYGWKPDDLYFWNKTKKHMNQYRSEFVESCWKDVEATEDDIKKYNEKYGTDLDYLPLGFVTIGDVTEMTAPYIAKYVAKFKEISTEDFKINGVSVRKPYMVYPREMLGWQYFLENIKDIIGQGHLIMSNGKYCGIPRSWLKKLKSKIEDLDFSLDIQELYGIYLDNLEKFFEEEKKTLEVLGYDTPWKRYLFYKNKGEEEREKYEKYRLVNTGKEMI